MQVTEFNAAEQGKLNFFGLHPLAQAVQKDASELRALLEPG